MLQADALAAVMAVNVEDSDITFDELVTIVSLYVKLHNRLYQDSWDEKEYLNLFSDHFERLRGVSKKGVRR